MSETARAEKILFLVCPKCGRYGPEILPPGKATVIDSCGVTAADLDLPRGNLFTEDGRQIGITGWSPIAKLGDALRVEIHGLIMRPDKPAVGK